MRRGKNFSPERGATLVEFAFALPLTLMLLIGILEFSRALYAYHFVSYAARASTRWASVRGSNCLKLTGGCPAAGSDIFAFVRGIAPPGLYVASNSGCTTTTVGCLTINCPTCSNSSKDFIWPGTSPSSTASDCTSGGTYPPNSPGCVVVVQVEYTWSPGVPLIPYTLVLTSTSQYTISN